MKPLDPSFLMPSHGPVIGGAAHKLDSYLAHRLERERKILAAVVDSDGSLSGIVEQAYQDTPPMLRTGPDGGLAGRSALAHLNKLVDEGRVQGNPKDGYRSP